MRYSTKETRDREAMAMLRLARLKGASLRQLPEFSAVDGILQVDYPVEVKIRTHAYGDFPTVWLQATKVESLGNSGVFHVEWTDRWGFCSVPKAIEGLTPEPVLRGDREGETPDMAYLIPIDRFTTMEYDS